MVSHWRNHEQCMKISSLYSSWSDKLKADIPIQVATFMFFVESRYIWSALHYKKQSQLYLDKFNVLQKDLSYKHNSDVFYEEFRLHNINALAIYNHLLNIYNCAQNLICVYQKSTPNVLEKIQ